MQIIEYASLYKDDFISLNTEWIVENFGHLEKEDIETFEKLEQQLSKGAMIHIALDNNTVMAVCMTKPIDNYVWEICKLASNKSIRGKGVGSAVFEASMNYAINHGAKKLFLVSNKKLKSALNIYKKYGFKEVPFDNCGYIRVNIAYEYTVR